MGNFGDIVATLAMAAGKVIRRKADDSGFEAFTPSPAQMTFTYVGNLTAGAGTIRIYNKLGRTITISQVFLGINTPPLNQAVIVDANINGATMFTDQAHRPQIAAGANTGTTTTIDVATVADGDYITVDIDQIGTGTVGADMTVHIIFS